MKVFLKIKTGNENQDYLPHSRLDVRNLKSHSSTEYPVTCK